MQRWKVEFKAGSEFDEYIECDRMYYDGEMFGFANIPTSPTHSFTLPEYFRYISRDSVKQVSRHDDRKADDPNIETNISL